MRSTGNGPTDQSAAAPISPPRAGWRHRRTLGLAAVGALTLVATSCGLAPASAPASNPASRDAQVTPTTTAAAQTTATTTAPAPTTTTPPPTTTPTTAPASGRNAFQWPFASNSPWNMPVGSGAQFATTADARTQDLLSGSANINAGSWSQPVYQATASSPMATMSTPSGSSTYQIPAGATPSSPTPGDQSMDIVDPSGHWVDETWLTSGSGTSWSASYHVRTDITGTGVQGGTRAAGTSAIAGLIRTWEIQAGVIRHALAFAMPRSTMALGPVWPAISQDSGAVGTYTGALPMGTLVSIPLSVNLNTLGLSPTGLAIARALQQYGAYLVDASSQFTLYAEPSADPLLGSARNDLAAIHAQLRVITNNSPSSVGGGGQPLAPLAPPLG